MLGSIFVFKNALNIKHIKHKKSVKENERSQISKVL